MMHKIPKGALFSQDTLDEYDLVKQPFIFPYHREDLFTTQATEMLINVIYNHLENDDMLLVVKGERGSGKTSFIQILLTHDNNDIVFLPVYITGSINANRLLKQILPEEQQQEKLDGKEIAKEAAVCIFNYLKNQKQPVLVIDDAHKLPFDTLNTLFKYLKAITQQGHGKVKLLFVGDKSIDNMLNKVNISLLDKESIFSTMLRPLSKQQIIDYLDFIFNKAGSKNGYPLRQKEMTIIQNNSSGLPLKVNYLATRMLQKSANNILLSKPMMTAALVALIILIVFLATPA